jgi:hypothetical protein
MTSRDDEQRSIERMERAFKNRQSAFIKMRNEFYPYGIGVVGEDVIAEFDSADSEFRDAQKEMDTIAEQIRNGTRK